MIGKFLSEKRSKKNIAFSYICSILGVSEDYVIFLEAGQIFAFGEN